MIPGRVLAGAALGVLATAGCGFGSSASSGHPSSSPGSHGVPAGSALIAVLQPGGLGPTALAHSSVAIVSLTGQHVAQQSFQPRGIPQIGPAEPVLQEEAVAAGGEVFYVDGAGQVRALAPDGSVKSVTRFPLTSNQQVLAFSVSPDGGKLAASLFTWPPLHNPPPRTPMDPTFGPGDMTLDLYTATPGGQPVKIRHQSWPQGHLLPMDVMQVVAWGNVPLVTTNTILGTQQPLPGMHFFGHLAELDDTGHPGSTLGGPDCDSASVTADENVLCMDSTFSNPTVHARGGSPQFPIPNGQPGSSFQGASLAPDGLKAVFGNVVVAKDGSRLSLPPQFYTEGWTDPNTVIGVQITSQGESNLQLISLSNATSVRDLGVKGLYVGMVRPAR